MVKNLSPNFGYIKSIRIWPLSPLLIANPVFAVSAAVRPVFCPSRLFGDETDSYFLNNFLLIYTAGLMNIFRSS